MSSLKEKGRQRAARKELEEAKLTPDELFDLGFYYDSGLGVMLTIMSDYLLGKRGLKEPIDPPLNTNSCRGMGEIFKFLGSEEGKNALLQSCIEVRKQVVKQKEQQILYTLSDEGEMFGYGLLNLWGEITADLHKKGNKIVEDPLYAPFMVSFSIGFPQKMEKWFGEYARALDEFVPRDFRSFSNCTPYDRFKTRNSFLSRIAERMLREVVAETSKK